MENLRKDRGLLRKTRQALLIVSLVGTHFSSAATNDPILQVIHQAEQISAGSDNICHQEIYDRTRLLIYAAFLDAIKELPVNAWDAVVNRYSSASYLACMESNGRPVTIVTHRRERYSSGAKYGYKIADLDHYLNHFNKMSWDYRNASFNQWYDATTNFGIFQISPDQMVNNKTEKQRRVSSAFHKIIIGFQDIARRSPSELMNKCFSRIMYMDDEFDPTKPLVKNILGARSYSGEAPQNASSKLEWVERAQKIQNFAVSNILCPRLNLELAKALMTLQPEYFGPHLVNSKRCGNRALTCRPTLNAIIKIIKNNMSDVHNTELGID